MDGNDATTDWCTIISAHEVLLWRTAYRILNHREDALDCCQQAVLDAYEYSLTHQVDQWGGLLTSLTVRRAIDRLRHRVRSRRMTASLEEVTEPLADGDGPVELAEASELIGRLRNALAALPDKQAEVFWLSCVEQSSHAEIGRLMAISPNESRVLLHRARAQLASMLDTGRLNAGRGL